MKSVYGIIRVRPRVTNSTTCRLVSFQRNRISDEQRGISERFFEGRMVETGTMYKETVLKASTDTGLTKAQVEVSLIILFNSVVALYQVVPHFISIIPRIKQN